MIWKRYIIGGDKLEAEFQGSMAKRGLQMHEFFHQVANSNRKNNFIESLLVNGLVSSDQTVIRDDIV